MSAHVPARPTALREGLTVDRCVGLLAPARAPLAGETFALAGGAVVSSSVAVDRSHPVLLVALLALTGGCGGSTSSPTEAGADAAVDVGPGVTRAPWERCRRSVDACSGGASCERVGVVGSDAGTFCALPCGDAGRCPAGPGGDFAFCLGERCAMHCNANACSEGFSCVPTGVPELRFCAADPR